MYGRTILTLVAVLALVGSAQAALITNGSFEDPDVAGNNKAFPGSGNIPDCSSSTNASGSAHIGNWDSSIPGVTGGQHAMVYIAGSDNGKWIHLWSDSLGTTVVGTYTVAADFASANTGWQDALVELQFWVGGVKEQTVAGTQTGSFVEASLTYDAPTAGLDYYVQISFTGGGGSGNPNKAAVDNVRVTAPVIPEPATMSLLALGGLGVLIRRRRK